jgi:4-hydroxy-tetrahydrodipicolinate synthase
MMIRPQLVLSLAVFLCTKAKKQHTITNEEENKMALFKGSGVAIVTPFKEDLTVDYDRLETLIEFQIENGTDAIIICGTTGEASTLTDDEQIDCIAAAVKYTNKRVPVIAGTGSNDTRHGISLSQRAEAVGADGLLHVTPYYNKTSQKGLYEHYKAIAESVNMPIILYNVPSRTGMNILPDTALKLSAIDNIVAIKEASGNIAQVAELAQKCAGKLDIYSGNDDQVLPLLSLGGVGVISVAANVIPREMHDMVALYLEGKHQESLALQLDCLPLINALFCDVNPIPVKSALNILGGDLISGPCRAPLTTLEPHHQEMLTNLLNQYFKR